MRACEGCRRRKIKCDAATTNTWPCSACIRLKLHCVRPNGFDGAVDPSGYDDSMDPSQFQPMSMQQQVLQSPPRGGQAGYPGQGGFAQGSAAGYQTMPYDTSQPQPNMNYTTVPPPVSMVDQQSYAGQNVFPTPPMQPGSRPDDSSPEAYSPDSYQQQDLADLLGTLKVDETGAGMNPY